MTGKAYNQQVRRMMEGLSEEEKKKKIKEIAMKQELAYWRSRCLRLYREKEKEKVGEL